MQDHSASDVTARIVRHGSVVGRGESREQFLTEVRQLRGAAMSLANTMVNQYRAKAKSHAVAHQGRHRRAPGPRPVRRSGGHRTTGSGSTSSGEDGDDGPARG